MAYSTMQLVSLRSPSGSNGDNVVRKFVFKSRAIASVECNRRSVTLSVHVYEGYSSIHLLCRVIAVVFQKRIVVLDAGSFENKFVIRSKALLHN